MTLPHLWRRVRLRSYKGFRNREDGGVEGFGGGSPFSMGLNALVTHSVAGLVRELELAGERGREGEEEEASKVGRVSESGMILGIAVRAAVDKCVGLESFKWDMQTRLPSNVLGGLAGCKGLERLWLRFPGRRCPAPQGELPVLEGLREFTFTEFDPLCYPDDVSRLLEGAVRLETLDCHFSPRMREVGEPSVQLSYFFRRNVASKRRLRLRRLGIYNLFARAEQMELMGAIDMKCLKEFTSLNSFGPDEGETGGEQGVRTSFLDRSWLEDHDDEFLPPTVIRMDHLHKIHSQGLQAGLEKLYLVNARYGRPVNGLIENSAESTPGEAAGTTVSKLPSPVSTPKLTTVRDSLRDLYLDSICKNAGPTLKHLIFPAKWPLGSHQLARLIRSCPHLTQLSVAIQEPNLEHLRMIIPFLQNLYAIRLMVPAHYATNCGTEMSRFERFVNREDAIHENKLRDELASGDFRNVRYIGLGRKIWEVGGLEDVVIRVPVEGETEREQEQEQEQEYREVVVSRRIVKKIGLEGVKDVEIWKCDTLDVL